MDKNIDTYFFISKTNANKVGTEFHRVQKLYIPFSHENDETEKKHTVIFY